MFQIIKKAFKISRVDKKYFVIFFFTSFLYALIELFSIGLVVTFIVFLLNGYEKSNIPLIEYLPEDITFDENLINYLLFFFLVVFILRFLVILLLKYLETSLKKKISVSLVTKTFNNYLDQSYEWYFSFGFNRLMVNILENSRAIVDAVIIRFFSILTSVVMLVMFISTVFFVNPIAVTMVVTLLGLIALAIYKIFSKKNQKIGERLLKYSNLTYSFAKSALESFTTIKVLNKKKYFLNKFESSYLGMSDQIRQSEMLREIARVLLELIFIILIFVCLFFSFKVNNSNFLELENLMFFSLIFLRSLPHIYNILNYSKEVKRYKAAVNSVSNIQYELIEKNNLAKLDSFEKISFKNVKYDYKTNKNFDFEVSLDFEKGKSYAIVGLSGSGKTTLCNLLMGLLKPKSGKIMIDKNKLDDLNLNFMSYVPQRSFLVPDTFGKNVSLSDIEEEKNKLLRSLDASNLKVVYDRYGEKIDNFYGNEINLSSGEIQRLSIARSLYSESKILVLDEPTSNLDAINENKFMDILNRIDDDITIIMITHKINLIKKFDQIFFIDKGRCISRGNYNELKKKCDKFKSMININL